LEAAAMTRAQAEAGIADRRPSTAIVLPRGFERIKDWQSGGSGERPPVEILFHPMAAAERQWAEGALTEIVMRRLARVHLGANADIAPPFAVHAVPMNGAHPASFNAYTHSFSGMTLQYLLFWGMESGLLLLRERQRGSWARVRAAPVPLAAVLLGKALATAAIALLVVMATFGFGSLAFGIRIHGSRIGFVLLALAASGLAAATGLLVAALGGSEARARSVSILAILGISMLGGLWLPAFLLPGWLREIALSLPTTWAMRGLDAATWQGQSLTGVLGNAVVVAAFAVVFLAIAALLIRAAEHRKRRGLA
jgi:ABC-2 type transport system permease protein